MKNFIIHLLYFITVEHWLFISATIQSNIIKNHDQDILREFIKISVPHIIPQRDSLPTFAVLLICYINESATFVWSFVDIFIMIVGVGLSSHFKVLNYEMEQAIARIEVKFFKKFKIRFINSRTSVSISLLFRICRTIFGWKCEYNIQNCVTWFQRLIKKFHHLYYYHIRTICLWFVVKYSKVHGKITFESWHNFRNLRKINGNSF